MTIFKIMLHYATSLGFKWKWIFGEWLTNRWWMSDESLVVTWWMSNEYLLNRKGKAGEWPINAWWMSNDWWMSDECVANNWYMSYISIRLISYQL